MGKYLILVFSFFIALSQAQLLVEQPLNWIPESNNFLSNSLGKFGDYNNDGLLDLIIGGGYNYGYSLYQNNGNGYTKKATFSPFGLQTPNQAQWGDYDGDGFLDLLLAPDLSTERPLIYKNKGDGTFVKQSILIEPLSPSSADWVDLDGDGDLDLIGVGAGAGDKKTLIYRNEGVQFTKVTHTVPPSMGSVNTGDFDRDGDQDLLLTMIGDQLERTEIYVNDGTGQFTREPVEFQPLVTNYGTFAKWIDADSDGDQDIYLVSYTNSYETFSRIIVNEGTTRFNNQRIIELPAVSAFEPQIGDLDNDGDPDILLNDWFTPTMLRNDGGLSFSKVRLPIKKLMGGKAMADADNDGDLDLVQVGGVDTVNVSYGPRYLRNDAIRTNAPPGSPSSLSTSFGNGKVTFNWSSGSDDQTGTAALSYGLYLFNKTTGKYVVTPHADTVSGFRRIAALGNSGPALVKSVSGLASGTYVAGVQSVDASFIGSAFVKTVFDWGIVGNSQVCDGDTAIYSTTSGLTGYEWSVTGGSVAGQANTQLVKVVWNGTGTRQISLRTGLGSFSFPVNTLLNPEPVIVSAPPALKVNAGSAFQWFSKSPQVVPVPGADGIEFTPAESGLYFVRVKYSNGCVNDSEPFNFILTGITSEQADKTILFPNPAGRFVMVGARGGIAYRIRESSGRIVLQGITVQTDGKVPIDISELTDGLYLLELPEKSFRLMVSR